MAQRILVAGITAFEVTYRVDSFPLNYEPVRYAFSAMDSGISGSAYNVACALHTLGDEVHFATLLGQDIAGAVARQAIVQRGLHAGFILDPLPRTPHALVLYDSEGRRQIHVDLKDVQERSYPEKRFAQALEGCALAVVSNASFCRPLLRQARDAGVPVATDVHTVSQVDDLYNQDFMREADILFLSHERLDAPPQEWLRNLRARCDNALVIIGMGENGALLSVRGSGGPLHVPAVRGLPVVSTVGAGDALLSCFVHTYLKYRDPYRALRRAMAFAACKLGVPTGAEGFLSEEALSARFGPE